MKRPFPIILACILLLISGVLGIIFGGILVIGGGILGGFIEELELGWADQFSLLGIYGLGILAIIWSVLEIAAAYGLWNFRKWGAYIVIVLSLISIGIAIGTWNILSIIDIVFSILILFLVALSWRTIITD